MADLVQAALEHPSVQIDTLMEQPDIQQTASSAADISQFIAGAIPLVRAIIDKQYRLEGAEGVHAGAGAGTDAFAANLANQQEQAIRNRYQEPLYNQLRDNRDALLAGYYRMKNPQMSEEQIQKKLQSASIEKLIANALLWKQGHFKALDVTNNFLKRQGVGWMTSPNLDRQRRAMASMTEEMYRQATSLSPMATWQGLGDAGKRMEAAFDLYNAGAFKNLFNRAGIFDTKGRLTDYGRQELSKTLSTAGRSLHAIRQLTGAKDAKEALQQASNPQMFGRSLARNLDDPQTASSLFAYMKTAQATGLTPDEASGLLSNLQKVYGGKNIVPTLAIATQMLNFEQVAGAQGAGDAGDPELMNARHYLTQRAMQSAIKRRGGSPSLFEGAAASFAALAPVYGEETARNYVGQMLSRRPATGAQMIRHVNKHLGGRPVINRQNLQYFVRSPEAAKYLQTGDLASYVFPRAGASLLNEFARNNQFLRQHAKEIWRQEGSLSQDAIGNYLERLRLTPEQKGRVMASLDQSAERINKLFGGKFEQPMTAAHYLHWIDTAGRGRDLHAASRRAYDFGELAAKTSDVRASSGVEGLMQSIGGGGTPTWGNAFLSMFRSEPNVREWDLDIGDRKLELPQPVQKPPVPWGIGPRTADLPDPGAALPIIEQG